MPFYDQAPNAAQIAGDEIILVSCLSFHNIIRMHKNTPFKIYCLKSSGTKLLMARVSSFRRCTIWSWPIVNKPRAEKAYADSMPK